MHSNETRNQTHTHYYSYSWDYLSIICVTLAIINIILHCLGIWVMFKTTRKIKEHVEILSLSFNLICFGVFSIVHVTLLIELPAYGSLAIIFISANVVPFYAGMILLTLQRFFAIWLHLRYESSWVFLKRTHMMVASWLAGAAFLVIEILLLTRKIESAGIWLYFLISITPMIGLILTNCVFFCTYTYIYVKYRRATQATRNSLYRNRKAKFFTPVIICASFFLFGTIPHFLYQLHGEMRLSYVWFLLDGISNFFVYIFMNEKVMRLFKQKTQKHSKNRSTSQTVNSTCKNQDTSEMNQSNLA